MASSGVAAARGGRLGVWGFHWPRTPPLPPSHSQTRAAFPKEAPPGRRHQQPEKHPGKPLLHLFSTFSGEFPAD